MKNRNAKLLSITAILSTCAYSCTFIYFQNVGEGNFSEIIFPFCIFTLIAALVTFLSWLFFKKLETAAFFSCLAMFFFMNFNLLGKLLLKVSPNFRGEYILLIFVPLYLLLAVYLKKKAPDTKICLSAVSLVFCFLILWNGIFAVPAIIDKLTFEGSGKTLSDTLSSQEEGAQLLNRNVYYFIFDEYGGPESLAHYYNFDNQDFKQFLSDAGFIISQTSHNSESTNTVDIIPNVLNLNYVTEIDGTSKNNMQYTENPVLYQFFAEKGYQVNLVNHRDTLRTEKCRVISMYQGSNRTDTLTDYLFNQSMIYNLTLRLMPQQTSTSRYAEGLSSAINDMKHVWEEASDRPTLTVCYLQCPHAGFVFDQNGNRLPEEDSLNWADKDLYIGQLLFLNSQIEETVSLIQSNDPEAIIVLQSDHGARYAKHCMYLYDEADYDAKAETRYMQNILNCVYWGEGNPSADIEGLSGINTWRTILNTAFGGNLELLPEPEGYLYEWRKVDGIQ